ncbi:hypothetical protein LTS15_009470 [Exophiala xenobiotica]|nr:hypothetical protein LTS15_009470 [Exophiala xenobiotica]
MTIRMCQELRLMVEPDRHYDNTEREERRRVFWSTYLLDKLVSIGRLRPAGISDGDCQVQLPSSEHTFRKGSWIQTSTIHQVQTDDLQVSSFALVVFMASILGRCTNYVFNQSTQQAGSVTSTLSSPLAALKSDLAFFSLNFDLDDTWESIIAKRYTAEGIVDQQQAGHFILSHGLFHLCHCLLNHPFLLLQHHVVVNARSPAKFLTRSFHTCRMHAIALTSLMRDIQNANCIATASIYGYFAVVAGTMHALYLHSDDILIAHESGNLLDDSLLFLQKLSIYWPNAETMALSLRNFRAESAHYYHLLSPPFHISERSEEINLDHLVEFLEYSIVATRVVSPTNHCLDTTVERNGHWEIGAVSTVNDGLLATSEWASGSSAPAEYHRPNQRVSEVLPNSNHESGVANAGDHSTVLPPQPARNPIGTTSHGHFYVPDLAGRSIDANTANARIDGDQQHQNLSPLSQFLMKETLEHSGSGSREIRDKSRAGL